MKEMNGCEIAGVGKNERIEVRVGLPALEWAPTSVAFGAAARAPHLILATHCVTN
jgi:hypothetical protein